MTAGLRLDQSWFHGCFGIAVIIARALDNTRLAELRAAFGGLRVAPLITGRIDCLVKGTQPAAFWKWFIAYSRYDEEIARAGGRHVGDTNAFRPLADGFFVLIVE
jgi:hypothetical protein